MEKKQKQIIIALVVTVLILSISVLLVLENAAATAKTDLLEVTYRVSGSDAGLNPKVTFSQYLKHSMLIVSVNVTESQEQWDTPDGSPWQFDLENPKPGEGPSDHYNKECYMDVNEVLKGNFGIDRVLFKTNALTPDFKEGEEYIIFIACSKQNDTYYYKAIGPLLLKNESGYQGTINPQTPPISKTYDELKRAIFISKLNPF
jgi:hypothetical protein